MAYHAVNELFMNYSLVPVLSCFVGFTFNYENC